MGYNPGDMRVAIVGAGPAGAHLSCRLSQAGCEVLLFDAREAWEKPCGGGVTSKALGEFPFLREAQAPKQMVSALRLLTARGREVRLAPRRDFAIFSRTELARLMRRRAVEAGAALHCARVERTERRAGRWEIRTAGGVHAADFLVGADGAASVLRRRFGVRFPASDFGYALGWHVRPAPAAPQVEIQYLAGLSGYLWAFPRTDHLSYGIVTRYGEASPGRLKAILLDFIAASDARLAEELRAVGGRATPRASFYAAMIPALGPASWDRLAASNWAGGWALAGDAAGFADPVTGEGIYYAIKSADLLARALLGDPGRYEELWRAEFGGELRRAAEIERRFYHGRFAGAPLVERMVQLARRHRGVRETLRDLIAGDQGYMDLKRRLRQSAFSII